MKTLLTLLLALNITACSPIAKDTDKQAEPQSYDDTFYNYWPTESESKILYEVITHKEEHFTGQYPAIANLEPTHPLVDVTQKYQSDVENALQNQISKTAELAKNNHEATYPSPHDHSIAWLGGRYHPQLWSLAFQVYSYTGGAHPNHWTNTHNYHPASNTILKLQDLFNDPAVWEILDTAVLAGVISEKQKRWDEWDGGAYDSTQDFFMEDVTFNAETLDAWVVTKKEGLNGLLFFFDPYDVGPYAEGGYEVFVPIAVVQEFIKEEFRGVFE